jgi:nucleotide-binding universal stress UspA family protein
MDIANLAELLRETAEHHDPYEKTAPKHDWWDWYASYISARNRGSTPEEAFTFAGEYVDEALVTGGVGVSRAALNVPGHNHPIVNNMSRILVATDDSHSSADAIAMAVELASEHGSELIVVHVVPTLDLFPTIGADGIGGALPHEPTEYEHALLASAAMVAAEHGVGATTALLRGSPAREIVAYAESCAVDLIVVGSRGHGAVASALLGSVSLGVLRESNRSVVIVHGATAPQADGESPHAVARGEPTQGSGR